MATGIQVKFNDGCKALLCDHCAEVSSRNGWIKQSKSVTVNTANVCSRCGDGVIRRNIARANGNDLCGGVIPSNPLIPVHCK